MTGWLVHVSGLDDPSGRWYLFWSGPFPDIPLLVLGAAWLRHRNCHARGCPRIGRFPVEGTAWTVCSRHHPDGAPSATDLGGAS